MMTSKTFTSPAFNEDTQPQYYISSNNYLQLINHNTIGIFLRSFNIRNIMSSLGIDYFLKSLKVLPILL